MGIHKKTQKERSKISSVTKKNQPKFVRKEHQGNNTYEIYKRNDAESAKSFLLKKKVKKKLYYIIVETPEGNWGMDVEGLFLERLLPWQININSAQCEGNLFPMSYSKFGLEMAAKGFNDNFVIKVECGNCKYHWFDGIRYQNITVVRCPKCKTLNKVDSRNIKVLLV